MNWFQNLRVKSKLVISFAVVIVFAIVLAALSVITVNRLDNSYSYLLNFPQKRLEYLMQVDTDCAVMRRCAAAIAVNAADSSLVENYWGQFGQAYNDSIDKINKYLESNNADTVRDPATLRSNNEIMSDLKKQLESYHAQAEAGVEIANATGDMKATNEPLLSAAPIMAAVTDTIKDLIPKAANYTVEVSGANTRDKDSAVLLFLIVLAVIIILSVMIALYMSGLISKPMSVLTAFMKKAGTTGDITLRPEDVEIIGKLSQVKDEMGQCIGSAASFVTHMIEVSDKLETVANGDLTAELALLSQDDVMGGSLNKMIRNLHAMFGELKTASNQVSAGAGQVSQAAQGLASGSSEQAASIEEFSASLTELQEKTNNNAENSAKAREANNKAGARLGDSIRSMSEMLEAMKAIDESSTNITKVIKVIDDIAFQTNILALNAAVEAARAGQHGKGFAVVADEVRNLASKSAAAAKETASLIEGSSERVREGNQIVAKTNADLEAAAQDSRDSTRLIEQVAAASTEQARSILEINQGVEQISTVVQANSATAEQSAAAAQEMSAQSAMLNEIVAKFKLNEAANVQASESSRVDAYPGVTGFALAGGKY